MSKAGRKPNEVPREQVKFWMRIDLAAELRLWLMDPVKGKVAYGELTKYFEGLVEKDLAEKRRNAKTGDTTQLRESAGANDSLGGDRSGPLGEQGERPRGEVVRPLGESSVGGAANQPPAPGTSVDEKDQSLGSEGQGPTDKVD